MPGAVKESGGPDQAPPSRSAIALPATDYPLYDALPPEVVSEGKLSQLQLEGVMYACTKHQELLPSGERARPAPPSTGCACPGAAPVAHYMLSNSGSASLLGLKNLRPLKRAWLLLICCSRQLCACTATSADPCRLRWSPVTATRARFCCQSDVVHADFHAVTVLIETVASACAFVDLACTPGAHFDCFQCLRYEVTLFCIISLHFGMRTCSAAA
jgi:hypothetical protein